MREKIESFYKLDDFVPSLRQAWETNPLDLKKIILAMIPVKDPNKYPTIVPAGMDRRSLSLTDGKNSCFWETD